MSCYIWFLHPRVEVELSVLGLINGFSEFQLVVLPILLDTEPDILCHALKTQPCVQSCAICSRSLTVLALPEPARRLNHSS